MMSGSLEINIPIGIHIKLKGSLSIPEKAESLVIFSHGSGSSRLSPRNISVARMLNENKIATLLVDLLTETESEIYENRFNIDLLTDRLTDITKYIKGIHKLKDYSIGYFGASTGAAAALKASVNADIVIQAIVSRGGRPDLAINSLEWVKAPTLLIVGSLDEDVIELNEKALRRLKCEKKLEIVEGATHLFEELGKLNEVSKLAIGWFKKYLHEVKAEAISN
jgi:putative phosphoribosyl transferase